MLQWSHKLLGTRSLVAQAALWTKFGASDAGSDIGARRRWLPSEVVGGSAIVDCGFVHAVRAVCGRDVAETALRGAGNAVRRFWRRFLSAAGVHATATVRWLLSERTVPALLHSGDVVGGVVGAMQDVASVVQFRPETAPGRVFVASRWDCSSDVKNGAMWRRSGEGGGPATKLAALSTGRPVSLVFRDELQSVSAVLIVGWIGEHQVFFRPFLETKACFGQVVHFKERALLQLEGYRLCKVVIDQCGCTSRWPRIPATVS